jgi:hypothetical protein
LGTALIASVQEAIGVATVLRREIVRS